jgi:DNA-binding CsgD family transcriptional regulator
MDAVVGREPELAAVGEFLAGLAGGPAVLVLAGEPGIGKTTVWRAGVAAAQARGFEVLACRPAPAEVRLSYAGLADLLTGVDAAAVAPLPDPQRRALDVALLREVGDQSAPDPRPVAAGLLSILDGLAARGPVLVAIDDLQWLDEATRRVVEFAVRRCTGGIGVLVARRPDGQTPHIAGLRPRNPDRARVLPIGPLSLGALHHVVARRTGQALPRPALVRLAQASGGNPLFALELARSADMRRPGRAPLPASLRAVVQDRLRRLDTPVREALFVAGALARPQVDLIERALGEAGAGATLTLLGAAEDAGVVELSGDGTVGFTHPLLAAAAYADATPSRRRVLHRRLSSVVIDGEERARHLALAAVGPEPEAVAALDRAAGHARRRGAPAAAAELLELAIGLGADDPSRRLQAAHDHFHAGDPDRARELLEVTVAALPPGPARAEACMLQARVRLATGSATDASELLEQALAESAPDAALRCAVALERCFVDFHRGRLDTLRPAAIAVEAATQTGDDGLLAEALSAEAMSRVLVGEPSDERAFARALQLEDPERRSRAMTWPTLLAALVARWCGRLDAARRGFAAARQRALDQGADSELWLVLPQAISAACAAGDLETAHCFAEELAEHAQLLGTTQSQAFAAAAHAELYAWEGRVEEVRPAARRALALFERSGAAPFSLITVGALGMAELSLDDHAAAAGCMAPGIAAMASTVVHEPSVFPFLPDAVEALVALGRFDEAERLAALLEACGRRPERPWAEAVGARCRALLRAARGDLDGAAAAFEHALAAHDRLPELRYDRARTLLASGRLHRRRNRRRAAGRALGEAARLFDAVGCRQWAATARRELDRLGLKPGAGHDLTPTEERVAELAGSGMTVREVAAALIVSPKTVEAHVTRIYRKLGIHTRAELGAVIAQRRRATGASPSARRSR